MKKVAYTAIFGNYDKLREPSVVSKGWDYVLITDNRNIKSNVYKIIYADLDDTPVKNARRCKINYWEYLPNYHTYLWFDGSLQINVDLNEFCKEVNAEDYDMVLMKHPNRTCLYNEARTVVHLGIDKGDIIYKQLRRYRLNDFPEDYGLTATGMMIRKGIPSVRVLMSSWWNEVKDGSHRDQLSFQFVRWQQRGKVKINDIDGYWKFLERENGKFRYAPHSK